MKFKTHHVAITVQDTQESINWYEDKLGFEVTHRFNRNGMEITLLEKGGVRIELFCFGKQTEPLPLDREELMKDLHVIGTKHLCIEVEDLNQILQELQKKNIVPEIEIDSAAFGGRYTFIKDPRGILIELYQA